MGELKKLVLVAVSSLVMISSVDAATCGYKEQAKLNNEVANVKSNYEVKERVLSRDEYTAPPDEVPVSEEDSYVAKTDYIEVSILNLTENMYATVFNDVTKETQTIKYDDTQNGNAKIDWRQIGTIAKLTIKIYSSSSTACEGNLLKTLYLTLPRYNEYSEYNICTKVPDYYMCKRYVTNEEFKYDDFNTNVTKEIEKRERQQQEEIKNNKWYKKVLDFVSEHKTAFIIGGCSLVVVAGGATYIIIKKRRRSII